MKKFLHKHTKGMLVLFLALTGTMTAKADITFFVHTTQNWSEVKMHTWSGYDSWNDDASLFTAVPGATNTWVYTVTTNSNISFNGYAYSGALDGTTADHSARGVDVSIGDRTYTNGATYHIFHNKYGDNWIEDAVKSDEIYGIGDALNGWTRPGVAMTKESDLIYTYTGTINNGEIKFPTTSGSSWEEKMFFATEAHPDGTVNLNTPYTFVYRTHSNNDYKWNLPAGNYTIRLDLDKFTVTFGYGSDPMDGLTFLSGPFFISDGGNGTPPTSLSTYYAYANNGEISMKAETKTDTLSDIYKWNLYTINGTSSGVKNHFAIVNEATGQFLSIPTSSNATFTLTNTRSDKTTISLWDYSGGGSHATDANASAGLANTNIQNLVTATEYKGMNNGSAIVTKGSFTGHFKFITAIPVPVAPDNITAAPDCSATDKIIVTWDAAAGATSYDVEAYDSSTARWYEKAKNVTATTATITVAGGYKAYPIRVKANNTAGSSEWANAAIDGWPAPDRPTLSVSGTTANSITLSWTGTYNLYRSAHADGNYKLLASSQSNGYTDNAVFSGSKYWYKLEVTDAVCGTRWSNSVNATTGYTLGTPVASVTSKTASEVTIGWSAVAGAGAYNIYRSVDNVNYDYIGLTKETTYTDNLNRGNGLKTIYYYKVTAVEDGMEQWFYKGGTSRETATPLYVYADGDHIGSWYPDGHEYIYINGNIYYTYINSKQDSCWTVGGLSGGLAHFRETATHTGEYKAVVYSAETYNNDGYITFRLATDSIAVLNNATAYAAWNNVAIAPKCTTCSDNNGWQNYLPYVGAFPMTAGTNELYISPSGSLNFMKIVLSAGESDFSLAVPAEYIPQPVRQNPTINSMTSSTINWNAIEGAKYKIRFSPNFTKIENTSTNRWGIGQDGEDENGWITVNTNAYTLVAMSPTWQYRYEVKAFDESTGVESTVMSEDGCWISSRDYAPILTTSTSGQNITVTISDSKASEIKDYTLYYSKDKTTWTNVTVTKAASSYTLAGAPATLYFFKATATDAATDSISMPSVTVWAQTEEVTPALSIAGTTLSWTAVSNASKYSVMRKTGTGEYTKIDETADGSTLTYTDNSIEGGTNYTYKIVPTSAHCDIFEEWAYNEDGSANMVPNNEKNWGKDGKGTKYIDGVYYNTGEHYTAGNAGAWMKFTINAAYATNYTADAYIARERAYTITNYLSTNGTSGSKISSFEGPNLSGGPNRTGGCYGFGNGWQNYHVYTGNNPVAMTGESQDIYFTSGSCNFMKLVFWVNDFQTEGTASNEVEITTPPAITAVECNGGNSLVVEWSYNAEADSFRIYRSNTENGVYTQIARTEGTIKTYTDNTITFGDTYYYKVSAITGGEALTIADVMAQYASANDYALIVTDGAKGSDAANLYRTSATVIDGNNYITSGVTETNAHWSQECILEANPYQKNSAITSYIVACARLTEGTLNANDGICLVPNGYPDNMTSHANFKNIADYAALSTTEDTWFVIPTGTSGNSWIRTGIADADQNVAFRHIIYAASAPSLSTTEESDKSAAVAGGCTTMADTIIWTGSAATDAWNDIDNWDIIENGETRAIEASDAFGTPLTVIMPAELGTPTFDGGLGRINAASDIVLAYGALFDMDGFEDARGVCHSLTTSLVVRGEDRGEWILAGPNLKMKEGDGTREQLSGDYYLNKLPWVYMHEISIEQGTNPTISWQNAFPQLTKVLTPESAFAIRVDNKYGKYGINSERYYSKDSVKKHLGEQDVTFTFEGVPYPTPTFSVPAGNWTVITNTTTGNISIADLLNNEGGQAAVWNFNFGSKGNKGSWDTYANADDAEGVYVIPATAFLYKPATDMTAKQVLAYTDYTLSGKYHVTAALDGVPDPTLTLTAANGKYAAQTSVTYNAFISDEETEEPTNNALKVFSSYDGVPDICSYNGGTAYFSRTVNGSTTTVPLGVSATSDMTFTLTAQGAENFKAAVLDDRLTGISYNLKTQAALEFDIEAGENKDRFFLNLEYDDTLQPTTDIDENAADDITVTCNDKRIIIKSAGADLRKVRIADAAGRSTKTDASGRMEIIDMNGYANGVYMVTVWTKNGSKTERIIVK